MKTTLSRSAGLILLGISAFITPALAHSWVEELRVIAPNGTFTGNAGFPRGNVLRSSNPTGDVMTYLLPPNGGSNAFTKDMKVCAPAQTIGNQTPGSPALKASPGDMVAMRYQENGHVTIPNTQAGKPTNRGTVFIYGTSNPSNDDTYLGVKQWTANGKGGDGRGVLLATRNYDDGRCYQVNGQPISTQRQAQFPHSPESEMGVNMWCQSDVAIPANVNTATYTLYWVWDWPTAAGTPGFPNGKNESYTTCMDVQIVPDTDGNGKKVVSYMAGQDLNSAAIQDQISNAFQVAVNGEPAADAGSPTTQAPAVATSTKASGQGNGNGNGNGIETVTVTVPSADTVTVTHTVYGPAPSAASGNSENSRSQSPADVTTTSTSPATTANSPVGEQPDGGLIVTPFLTSTTPTRASTPKTSSSPNVPSADSVAPKPTTLATHTSASTKSSSGVPEGVSVTTVNIVDIITITTRAKPSQAPEANAKSVQIKGRWVTVK